MNSTLQLLKTHFDWRGWTYDEAENGFLYVGVDGQFLQWYGNDGALCVDVYFDVKGLTEHWPKVTAYLEQANGRLVLGNLRIDSNAGLIWFHHGIGFPEGELTESLIKEMLTYTVLGCKLFLHELSELASPPAPLHALNQFSGEELI